MNRFKKGSVALVIVIILALIFGFIYLFAYIFTGSFNNTGDADDRISSIVINYLEKKYGKQSWEITSTRERTTSNDTMGLTSTQIGFTAKAQANMSDDTIFFEVRTKGTDPDSTAPESDDFLSHYYLGDTKGIDNYANTGYALDDSFSFAEDKVPNSIGHIPSISEIASYGALTEISLYQTDSKSFGSNDAQKAENLKNLAIAVLNYHKITADTKIVVTAKDYGFHTINVSATSVTIKISGNDNLYTFSR